MADMTIANTIHAQLGGRQFDMMTGARHFIGTDKSLSFQIPRANDIRAVRVTLEVTDTYTVEFLSIKGTAVKTLASVELVYADQLQHVFTVHTGLLTSLGTMGRAR